MTCDCFKLVVKVNRLIKVFHFYGDLYQAVQNALSDGGTVIRHQQNLLRLRISFVRLIDIRYHAERTQTLDTPPVNGFYNCKCPLIVLFFYQTVQLFQPALIFSFIQSFHLNTFQIVLVHRHEQCTTLPVECQKNACFAGIFRDADPSSGHQKKNTRPSGFSRKSRCPLTTYI